MERQSLSCWLDDDSYIDVTKGIEHYNLFVIGEGTPASTRSGVSIWGNKEQMWELTTILLDTLMGDELTEVDLEQMDKAATKMGFFIQDAEVCHAS